MQHKYNAKQILFVKNVPRDYATRVEGLFTKHKTLETKNLYPGGQITTLMIALPSIGATQAALGETDGMRVNNTVISVERYNSKQSIVARREARKKRNNLPSGRANYDYDDEEDYDGFDGDGDGDKDEEERTTKQTTKATKLTAKEPEPVPEPLPRTRRVSESGGISWADLVGGKQADKPSPSPAPAPTPAKVNTPQEQPDEPNALVDPDQSDLPDDCSTSSEPASVDKGKARAVAVPQRPAPPHIALTPATAPIDLRPILPHPPSHSRLSSYDYLYTAPEGRTPPWQAQAQDNESSRIYEDSSQFTQAPDVARIERGMLGMPSDTTTSIRKWHCADCAFCRMRDRSQFRGEFHVDI
ncbi:hypothetical protein E8E11_004244 [Didymella keratinophila]|nr:hypothetical protein E8E11_004244 [Didymella keratinophila]